MLSEIKSEKHWKSLKAQNAKREAARRATRTEAEWYAEWKTTDMCCHYSVWRSMQK